MHIAMNYESIEEKVGQLGHVHQQVDAIKDSFLAITKDLDHILRQKVEQDIALIRHQLEGICEGTQAFSYALTEAKEAYQQAEHKVEQLYQAISHTDSKENSRRAIEQSHHQVRREGKECLGHVGICTLPQKASFEKHPVEGGIVGGGRNLLVRSWQVKHQTR